MQPSARPDYSQLMKQALLELTQLRSRLDDVTRAQTEPIAIIGMSCRLPGGVDSPDAFWRLLRDGVDAIGEVPPDRWNASAYYDANPDAPGKMATRFGGFLENADQFDPAFFGISPREARSLDPQQRLLLEVSWEALERSGQSPTQLYGSATGVFIGMSTFDYALHQVGGNVGDEDLAQIDGYVATGTTLSPAAGRLSYVLGLTGPAMVVDTACSSSLVATHLAVTSLRGRECDMALVGGVNLILRPEWNVNFTKAHMLAADGRCKTFDASADGYSRGEGCGIVVLQRLSDAVAARRNIIAVIRSSAVNQDGASGGLTVPSGPSQEQVIRRALDAAGIRPGDVSYVEAHGTGTSLGDPIEVAALGAVFGPGRSKDTPLRIGSVKTNIGHLEAAAGVAGLIKVALSLRHAEIPPHLHFRNGNRMIDWDGLPVEVPVERTPWPVKDTARRAGISSFGFTGTNAHLVLEEAPAQTAQPGATAGEAVALPDRPLHVLTLSARTAAALPQLAGLYDRHLAERPNLSVEDVAFTANVGRAHFRHRLAVVADSTADAQRKLAAHAAGRAMPGVFTGAAADRPKLVFLFTGQGSQYVGMGRQLYDTQPLFRETLDRCNEVLRSQLQRPLLDVLYPRPGEASLLDDTAYTQPALFAIECALARLWQSWGIEPDAVMGHSIGEYAAACVSGTFSLEDGLTLVVERARLMQALSRAGQMVAVQTQENRAAAAIAAYAADVSLAAVNGPNSVVISGASQAVAEVVASLGAKGIATQSLRVSHAFHSPLMQPMLADFERVTRRVAFHPPNREIVSNVTGRLATAEIATPEYWVRHVSEPVRFAPGMETLHQRGYSVFVEVGPSSTLLAMGRLCVNNDGAAWLPSLRSGHDWDQLLTTLAELYARGVSVDWPAFDRGYSRQPVELPTYPFQRQRYWADIGRQNRVERRPADAERRVAEPHTPFRNAEIETVDDHLIDDKLYEIEWCWRPRPQGEEVLTAEGRWIVLAGQGPLGTALSDRLRANGAPCTLVSAGNGFSRVGDEHFRVNPRNPADMEQLWAAVSANESIRGIANLWSLDASSTHDLDATTIDQCDAVETALQLVRTVAKGAGHAPPAIWCVTRGAVPIDHASSETALSLAQAPLWGFGRVVALEHPDMWGGLLDLGPAESVVSEAQSLMREFLFPDGEDQIAFRDDARYVPRLVRRSRPSAGGVSLDAEGTYLIAGGLGALGLHAARWLVSKGARSLVLASRRGLDTPGAEEAVRTLKAMGADRVLVTRADISSEQDVERVLAEIAATTPPLRGVVHAAGVDVPVPLVEMTPADLRSILVPKVRGAWLLHEKTRDLNLGLFVCFSSVSSVWGAPTRGHYAAANAFLDALAQERRRLGLAALTVNWSAWLGGGMAGDEELRQFERSGGRGLEPAMALQALEALIAGDDAQATVADMDWPRFLPAFEARRQRPLFAEIERPFQADDTKRSAGAADWIVRLQGLPAAQRASVLQELLRAEVADTLGFRKPEEVPVDQSVFELGMDSLRAVQLTIRLQQHLGLEESIHFFDCPQINGLAARLLERLALTRGAPRSESPADGVTGYTPERDSEILEFSRIAWPNRPDYLVQSRWHWMFGESAARLGVEPRVWLYRDLGRIVAHHGAIPVRLKVGSEVFDSAWFADTMVLESHRGSATGARLLMAANREFPVGLSLGQTEQMRKISLQLGSEQVAALQTFVLLLRPRRVLGDKLNRAVVEIASIGLNGRQYLKRLLSGPKDRRLAARPVDRFDARHDRLWQSVQNEYPCAVIRDASYLNWKYVTQPGQEFVRLEFLREGEVAAVAVFAVDDPGSIYRYRRALIVELVVSPSDSKLVLGVLESVRRCCAGLGVDAIVFHLINEKLEKMVRAYGFTQREPSRFLLVNPQQTSGETRRQLLSPSNWLITMGDSDIDRPWEAGGGRVQIRTPNRGAPCAT
jgi:acyl transferase domain-containing protein